MSFNGFRYLFVVGLDMGLMPHRDNFTVKNTNGCQTAQQGRSLYFSVNAQDFVGAFLLVRFSLPNS